MYTLEKLKHQVNQAYKAAVDCPCYKKKKCLLKKFYEMNSLYNQHKNWIEALGATY